ncbi:unnamed protein product [Arctogadus glacialis]
MPTHNNSSLTHGPQQQSERSERELVSANEPAAFEAGFPGRVMSLPLPRPAALPLRAVHSVYSVYSGVSSAPSGPPGDNRQGGAPHSSLGPRPLERRAPINSLVFN